MVRDDVIVKESAELKSEVIKRLGTLAIGDVVLQVENSAIIQIPKSSGKSVSVARIPIRAHGEVGWVTPDAAHIGGKVCRAERG